MVWKKIHNSGKMCLLINTSKCKMFFKFGPSPFLCRGLWVDCGGPSFSCSCALKAKNASLHEREIAALNEKEKELRESWKELASSLLMVTTNKSLFKRSDRTGTSAAAEMTETATGLLQRLNTESIWAEKETGMCWVSEKDANWKRLGSSTSYENDKIDCLATKAGSRKRRNPTLGTLLQQPNCSGDGVNHELGCNLPMLYLIWTVVHIAFHLT